MKKLSDYSGEESIIINGKIMQYMGEIIGDSDAMKMLQENQFSGIGEIMQRHSGAVYKILETVSGGEFDGKNAGVYFMQTFTDFCKAFGDSDFFNSSVTNE